MSRVDERHRPERPVLHEECVQVQRIVSLVAAGVCICQEPERFGHPCPLHQRPCCGG